MKNTELIMDNGKLIKESFKIGNKKYLELIMGQSPPSKFYNTDKIGLPFFQGKKEFGELYPEPVVWCSEPKKIADKGDILLSVRAPVGPTNLAKEECCIGRGLAALRPNTERLVTKYILYFFKNLELELQSKGQGSTFKAISAKDLRSMSIASPPLPEQRRIVSKLDTLFAEIDASLALIDQNIKQAEALKLSVLDEEFSMDNEELKIKNEEFTKLSKLGKIQAGGTPKRSVKDYWNGDINWFSSGELNDKYISKSKEYINALAIEESSAKLFPKNTLLIGMYDTAAFKMSIIKVEATCNQAIVGIKPKETFVPEFLYYQLNYLRPRVMRLRRGVRQKNLNAKIIRNIEIYLPSIKTQQKIVQKLDALFGEIDGLVNDYRQKRENLEALKSSLLDRAFKGKL